MRKSRIFVHKIFFLIIFTVFFNSYCRNIYEIPISFLQISTSSYIKETLHGREKNKLGEDDTDYRREDSGVNDDRKVYKETKNTNELQSPQLGGDVHDKGNDNTDSTKETLANNYIDIDIEKSDPFASSLIADLEAVDFCSDLYFGMIKKIIGILRGSEIVTLAKLAFLRFHKSEKYDQTNVKLKQLQKLIKQYTSLLHKCIYIFVDDRIQNITSNKTKPQECSLEEFKEKLTESQLLEAEISITEISIHRVLVHRNNKFCTGYDYKKKMFCEQCIELDIRENKSKRKLDSLKEEYQKVVDFVSACENHLFQEKMKKSGGLDSLFRYKSSLGFNSGLKPDKKYEESNNGRDLDKTVPRKRIPYPGEKESKDFYTCILAIKDNKQIQKAYNSKFLNNMNTHSPGNTPENYRIYHSNSEGHKPNSSSYYSTHSPIYPKRIPYPGEQSSKYSFSHRTPLSNFKSKFLKSSGAIIPRSKDILGYTQSQLDYKDKKIDTPYTSVDSINGRGIVESTKDMKPSTSKISKSDSSVYHESKSGFVEKEYKDNKLDVPESSDSSDSSRQISSNFDKISLYSGIKHADQIKTDLFYKGFLQFTPEPPKYIAREPPKYSPNEHFNSKNENTKGNLYCIKDNPSCKKDFLIAQQRLSKINIQTKKVHRGNLKEHHPNKNSISTKSSIACSLKLHSDPRNRISDTGSEKVTSLDYNTKPDLGNNSNYNFRYEFPTKLSVSSTSKIPKSSNKITAFDSDNSSDVKDPTQIPKGILKKSEGKPKHHKSVRFKDKKNLEY
ncbi:uncharacterized protein CMU_001790 [Cryptosporidium muris RN66]|uniref:Uncharacterized protein n=1 Tax=Cryptosporidium muris (strain RN66) TaxID=441375 RepID=B6AGG7_CRYMR|nr:uncharacterized protein CMU_001790 [Cryptosporidium muris RN66]EEA07308.1 hypothetical protein CMU_001790 [Cryptosporidium muris RN66]|eukprot:XP_002141657.1 hypothetical protein [Cryptosporidium muris RN66]